MSNKVLTKVLLGLASLLLPGLGHAISGSLVIALVWFAVYVLLFTHPIIAIASAVHYLAEA